METKTSLEPPLKIIGISGRAGVGKNLIVEKMLVPMLCGNGQQYLVVAFGDFLKIRCLVDEDADFDKLFGIKDEETRKKLTSVGSKARKDKGSDYWVRQLDAFIRVCSSRGIRYIFIADIRYPNEVEYVIKKGGFVYRIYAPQRVQKRIEEEKLNAQHDSETSLDDYPWSSTQIIHNDPGDDVPSQIRNIALKLRSKIEDDIVIFCDLDDTICECRIHYVEATNKASVLVENKDEFLETFEKKPMYKEFFARDYFARSLMETCKELGEPPEICYQAYELGMDVHNSPFKALPGALEKLREWKNKGYRIVIVTLGDPVDQVRKVLNLELFDMVEWCEATYQKSNNFYHQLLTKYPAKHHIMIGDSVRSDIVPALEAGIKEVYQITSSRPLSSIDI